MYKSVKNDSKKAQKHGSVFEQHARVLSETTAEAQNWFSGEERKIRINE